MLQIISLNRNTSKAKLEGVKNCILSWAENFKWMSQNEPFNRLESNISLGHGTFSSYSCKLSLKNSSIFGPFHYSYSSFEIWIGQFIWKYIWLCGDAFESYSENALSIQKAEYQNVLCIFFWRPFLSVYIYIHIYLFICLLE